jgi:hypothetical protein
MNKDLHNIDDLFRSSLEGYEETPSSSVIENLDAALDKKNAELYKKRFIAWKRIAIVFMLLLSGFILFEAGKINTNKPVFTFKNEDNKSDNAKKDISEHPVNKNSDVLKTELLDKKIELHNKLFNGDIHQEDEIVFYSMDKNSNYYKEKSVNTLRHQDHKIDYLQENNIFLTPVFNKKNILKIVDPPVFTVKKYHPSSYNDSFFKKILNEQLNQKKRNSIARFWALSYFYSYDFMNYRLDNDLSAVKKIKQREAHEPSFSTGILLTRQLQKGWSLQSGIIYSNTQIGINPQKMYALQNGSDVSYKYITSSGYAYIKPSFGPQPTVGDSLTTTQAKHTLQFLSIPLVIKHSFGKKKFTVNPGTGVEANFLTSAKVETEITDASNLENVTITKLKGERSFYWSVTANADIQYRISKKIAVSLRPSYRVAISPITKNNVVETYPYNFGMGAGIKIKL